MVAQGYRKKMVATVLEISRSSLYYCQRPRGSRADWRWDAQIVVVCGAKPAHGYRRVARWLTRKDGLAVNRKQVLRVMREQGCWCLRDDWGRDDARCGDVSKLPGPTRFGRQT